MSFKYSCIPQWDLNQGAEEGEGRWMLDDSSLIQFACLLLPPLMKSDGGYVLARICLFVCFFVCLLERNHEILCKIWRLDKDDLIRF